MLKTKQFRRCDLIGWEVPFGYEGMTWGDGFKILEHRMVDQTRWSIVYEAVFTPENDPQAYRVEWEVGATEYQDMPPWDGEEWVTATLVYPHEVTTIVYTEEESNTHG